METTERRFLHSLLAAAGSQIGRTALRLVADLTLARLILPQDHGLFALAWTLVAGMFRGLTYQRYEYWEAARYAQADVPGLVPALVLKHLVLVALVALGVVALVRLRRLGTRLVAAPEG